jgi:hypothetical protein
MATGGMGSRVEAGNAPMSVKPIPRESWSSFAEAFARQHEGWLVTIERHSGRKTRVVASDQPLQDLVIFEDQAVVRSGVLAEANVEELPELSDVRVAAPHGNPAAIDSIELIGGDEVMTIRFRTAIAPELVDGVP